MSSCYDTSAQANIINSADNNNKKVNYSSAAIAEIRTYFFNAIVELFYPYKSCIGEDGDGDTFF